MKNSITTLLEEAKKNNCACRYFQNSYDAHKCYVTIISRIKKDKSFDWSEYKVSVNSSHSIYYKITITNNKKDKDDNKYDWVVRNLTLDSLLNVSILPHELNNKKNLNWLLKACEKKLNQKVIITIHEKKDNLLIAKLERSKNALQSEIIFCGKNGKCYL